MDAGEKPCPGTGFYPGSQGRAPRPLSCGFSPNRARPRGGQEAQVAPCGHLTPAKLGSFCSVSPALVTLFKETTGEAQLLSGVSKSSFPQWWLLAR